MIDKWYYINLNSRIDKHYATQITCAAWQVPAKKLERIPAAIENENCPNVEELGRMITNDGFPEWGELYGSPKKVLYPHWIACNWSILRALRLVINRGENAVISLDTHYMCKLFYLMERELHQLPRDLKALHLTWWKDNPQHIKQQSKLRPTNVEGIYSNFALYTAGVTFYTTQGAIEYLEIWKRNPVDTQTVLFEAALKGEDVDGHYCCDPFWMKALGDNKPGYDVTRKDKEKIWI